MAATERTWLVSAALVLCASACVSETREGEGLYIADAGAPLGQSQTQSPATGTPGVPGSGQEPMPTNARTCVSVDLFTSRVTPHFTKDCVRCHDGTKGKATQLLNLTALRSGGAQLACDATLTTTNGAEPAASTILTFANPDDPSTAHDFKYATAAEFAVYRDSVLAWLTAE